MSHYCRYPRIRSLSHPTPVHQKDQPRLVVVCRNIKARGLLFLKERLASPINFTTVAKFSCGAYKKTNVEGGFLLFNRARTIIGDTLIHDQNIETWFHVARASLFARGPEFLKMDGVREPERSLRVEVPVYQIDHTRMAITTSPGICSCLAAPLHPRSWSESATPTYVGPPHKSLAPSWRGPPQGKSTISVPKSKFLTLFRPYFPIKGSPLRSLLRPPRHPSRLSLPTSSSSYTIRHIRSSRPRCRCRCRCQYQCPNDTRAIIVIIILLRLRLIRRARSMESRVRGQRRRMAPTKRGRARARRGGAGAVGGAPCARARGKGCSAEAGEGGPRDGRERERGERQRRH